MMIKGQRFVQNLLMLGWGIACLYWGIFADMEKLLAPAFQLPLICSGVIFVVISVISVDLPSLGKCSHDLSWENLGLGLLGLLAVLFCPAAELSMKTILNRVGENTVVEVSERDQAIQQNWKEHGSGKEIFLDLLDLFYVARDPQLRSEIMGKRIALIGQVAEKKGYSLMRITMWCCVADARPVMVEMRDYGQERFNEGDWIEVRGTVTFEEHESVFLPVIHYQQSKGVPAPEDIYLY